MILYPDIYAIIGSGTEENDQRRPDLSNVPNAVGYELVADLEAVGNFTHAIYLVEVYDEPIE